MAIDYDALKQRNIPVSYTETGPFQRDYRRANLGSYFDCFKRIGGGAKSSCYVWQMAK
jgi:hypothetical protein